MPILADRSEVSTAVRNNLGAIFVSLELSRLKWLITSLSPAESGMSCGRLIFIRSGGIRQVDFGQMISLRRMIGLRRTGHGESQEKQRGLSVGQPSYSSIEAINAPNCLSSVIAGR